MLYFWKKDNLKFLQYSSICVLITLFISGCTRDDICSEQTLTTPLLVIEFRDVNNRVEAKAVQDLRILINNSDSTVVVSAVNDTIVSIPLDTENNASSFLFILNQSNADNQNIDTVTFSYNREELYVNRACSFKMNYNQLAIDVDDEPIGDSWILDSEILNPVVANENEAHITIFH